MDIATDNFTNQVYLGDRSTSSSIPCAWHFVVHAQTTRYISDEELFRAFEKVTNAKQKPVEE